MDTFTPILSLLVVIMLQQAPTPIEVVDKVRQFYTDAWNQLIYFVTALFAVVGIIIPWAIQRYQQKTFRHEEAKLIEELSRKNQTIIEEIINKKYTELSDKLQAEMVNITLSLKRETARAETGALMVQARLLWSQEQYFQALESGLSAVKSALQSGDQANVQRVLNNITRDVLPHIKKTELDESPHMLEKVKEVFDELQAANEDRRYTNYILQLQKAYKEIERKRE